MSLASLIELHFEDVSVEDCVANNSKDYGATPDHIAKALGVPVSDLNTPNGNTHYCTISARLPGRDLVHSCPYLIYKGHVFPDTPKRTEFFMNHCSYLNSGAHDGQEQHRSA